jgi:hypothetical protein
MKVKWIGNILHRKCLLKQLTEEKIRKTEDEEEGVSSYWITLRKRKGTETSEREQ